MSETTADLRCTAVSAAAGEALGGTAPTDTRWLLVEQPGSWGRDAVRESGLPSEVADHLAGLAGVRVQLVRRHGGASGPGVRVFEAVTGPGGAEVRTAVLDDHRELLAPLDLTAYDAPLWLVCTNGRRDRCCAEVGRPVAGALAARWPEDTWETTHLGGHRFSGTLLALPSGLALGRLTAADAVATCEVVADGRVPLERVRGRAGLPGHAQHAELAARQEWGLDGLGDVVVEAVSGEEVTLRVRTGSSYARARAVVATTPGAPRAQSCGLGAPKPAPEHRLLSLQRG